MKYCDVCITPHNRPHIEFDARGRCNCARREDKAEIDWAARARAFRELADAARKAPGAYDCLIPVSGGKDSTWQVVTCLEHGLKPLCVTWRPPLRNETGRRNLENLIGLGVDHIDFSIDPRVERRFMYEALVRYGSPAVPMHLAIFGIPLTMAVRFRVPLVVWGENSAFEYGGDERHRRGRALDRDWLLKYGCTFGTTAEDWLAHGFTGKELAPYRWPSDEELASVPVRAVFLGAYFRWDPREIFEVARRHGFRPAPDGPVTGHYDYADVDDPLVAIHHWLKWYKFGFTRSFDNLSLEVRNGRLSREEAVEILRRRGDETPHEAIELFCRFVGIDRARFDEILERFRNPEVWERRDGRWAVRDFLVPDWSWT